VTQLIGTCSNAVRQGKLQGKILLRLREAIMVLGEVNRVFRENDQGLAETCALTDDLFPKISNYPAR